MFSVHSYIMSYTNCFSENKKEFWTGTDISILKQIVLAEHFSESNYLTIAGKPQSSWNEQTPSCFTRCCGERTLKQQALWEF